LLESAMVLASVLKAEGGTRRETGLALASAADHPTFHLQVADGMRPASEQACLWASTKK